MFTDSYMGASEQDNQVANSSKALKLPKIACNSSSPVNFDSTYDDLNKFSQDVQK